MTGKATFDRINSLLSYDPETGSLHWRVSPRCSDIPVGSEAGFLSQGYIKIGIDWDEYLAHRVAHLLMTGHWPEGNPEHANRIRHDNRWENIKDLARNQSENGGNHGLNSNNTSGLKGVCWDTWSSKWMARIKFQWKMINLGRFEENRLAGLHYDAAAKLAWGPRFACLNFPSEDSDYIVLPERVISLLGSPR